MYNRPRTFSVPLDFYMLFQELENEVGKLAQMRNPTDIRYVLEQYWSKKRMFLEWISDNMTIHPPEGPIILIRV